jgi:hypothetical protein
MTGTEAAIARFRFRKSPGPEMFPARPKIVHDGAPATKERGKKAV